MGRLAGFCDISFVERNAKGMATDSLQQCENGKAFYDFDFDFDFDFEEDSLALP